MAFLGRVRRDVLCCTVLCCARSRLDCAIRVAWCTAGTYTVLPCYYAATVLDCMRETLNPTAYTPSPELSGATSGKARRPSEPACAAPKQKPSLSYGRAAISAPDPELLGPARTALVRLGLEHRRCGHAAFRCLLFLYELSVGPM
eukprot:647201-Rhodomonas_salina.2